jgi:uncharacterized protein YggU (UPF0235/DUF167 family)
MRLSVRVTPRSAHDRVDGFTLDGILRVRVTAPPADGAANAAVARLLAAALGISGREVTLIGGHSSRLKQFDIPLDIEQVAVRLGLDAPALNRRRE